MPSMPEMATAPSSFDLLNDPRITDLLPDDVRNELSIEAVRELDAMGANQSALYESDGRLKEAHVLAQVLALRLYGYSPADTAAILGVPTTRVFSLLHRVRRNADIDSQLKRLDDIGVSLAADNIIRGLIIGDKDYTLEFAKGRGLFKTHQSVKQETTVTELKLVVEARLPAHLEGRPLPQIKVGALVGAPQPAPKDPGMPVIDGEVVDSRG
jgi:hypothetical protein